MEYKFAWDKFTIFKFCSSLNFSRIVKIAPITWCQKSKLANISICEWEFSRSELGHKINFVYIFNLEDNTSRPSCFSLPHYYNTFAGDWGNTVTTHSNSLGHYHRHIIIIIMPMATTSFISLHYWQIFCYHSNEHVIHLTDN